MEDAQTEESSPNSTNQEDVAQLDSSGLVMGLVLEYRFVFSGPFQDWPQRAQAGKRRFSEWPLFQLRPPPPPPPPPLPLHGPTLY